MRQRLRATALLANVFALAFTSGWGLNHLVAAEPGGVDFDKITGCWHVWVNGSNREAGRNFEITRVTESYRVEGHDVQGLELQGNFEPSTGGWFGYLGVLVLQAPQPRFDGYGLGLREDGETSDFLADAGGGVLLHRSDHVARRGAYVRRVRL
jgi:hypothetical protein